MVFKPKIVDKQITVFYHIKFIHIFTSTRRRKKKVRLCINGLCLHQGGRYLGAAAERQPATSKTLGTKRVEHTQLT